jgi:nitrogenase molybdenum-iron protein beta chain
MGADCVFLPDHDNAMDTPMTGRYEYYGAGGTSVPDIEALGGCAGLVALGHIISSEPAEAMNKKFKVPFKMLPLPVGVSLTDEYIMALKVLPADDPGALEDERGRVVDLLLDSSPYTSGKIGRVYGTRHRIFNDCFASRWDDSEIVITGTPKGIRDPRKELIGIRPAGDLRRKIRRRLFYCQLIKTNRSISPGQFLGKYIARAETSDVRRVPRARQYAARYARHRFRGRVRMRKRILDALMDARTGTIGRRFES